MARRGMYTSIALMLLAIMAVVGFQSYWLYNNYKEERQRFRWQTNVLFRETVFQCQVAKLNLDSTIKFRHHRKSGTVGIMNALKRKWRDSLKSESRDSTAIHRNKEQNFLQTAASDAFVKRIPFYDSASGDKRFIEFLQGVDSLQDSITVKEVSTQYAKILQRENINLPFVVTRTAEGRRDEPPEQDFKRSNEVSVGFLNPITFRVEFENTFQYLLKKLSPQILVSVLLIALTILSFVMLLRSLMKQRRLTELKNDFINNITHELKTPIATVSVAIEALKNFNALQDPDRTKEYLDISGNELQRLSLLVDKVLKLSMFEKQQIELKPEVFNLKQLVEEVVSSMRLQFEKHRADVHIKNSGANFTIKADRLHISSIIFNLLDNALKYSKTDPAVIIGLKEGADHIELSVTDNGIGISPEYKKKVFDKFFRVPAGDKHNVKGYGLGLSYISYVVKQHSGSIDVESQLEKGSKFTIKLPKHHA